MAAKILLMDSNVRLLTSMSERLSHLGYEVATATRVHDAVLKGIVVPPDLLVCDVMMPELNGWEVKRLAVHIPSLAETPMLFLGSHHSLPIEFYDPSAGLVDTLKKPVSADALVSAVAALLARRVARERLMTHTLLGSLPIVDASLLDLFQVLARRSATGVVHLTTSERSVKLVWSAGALVDATADQLRGDEAVYAAFAIPTADLSATVERPPALPPQQHVTRPLADLLAEALRRTRGVGDPERSQPEGPPRVEPDQDFLSRLASTGLIRRTAVSTP